MTDNGGGSKVGDFASLQRGITYDGRLVGAPGPALLGLGSIEPGGGFRTGHYKTFGGDCPSKLMLKPGDIYVALKGATKDGSMVGSVAKVPPSVPTGRLTQDTARLDFFRGDKDFQAYLYWVLRTPQYRRYCEERVTGSASASFSRDDFLSYPVVPPSSSAAHIVEVLEAIEAKLELHRFHNRTLEDMAAAIFKAWFIDFEPVKAKTAGAKSFPSMPQPVFNALPSSLVPAPNSPSGEIPKGWRVGVVGEEVEVVGGSTPSTSEPRYWDGVHCWATPKDLSKLDSPILLDTERKITDAGLAGISSGLLPVGSLVLSSRAPIGYLALVRVPTAINQGFIGMRCTKLLSAEFMLHWSQERMDDIKGRANGTTFQEISKGSFRPMPIVVPDETTAKVFDSLVKPLYEMVAANVKESGTLATLRDSLLPKLLSGEVRVAVDPDQVGASANG